MILFNKLKELVRPRTFAIQMLAAMLAVSLIPLLLLSAVAGQTVNTQLEHFNELNTAFTEKNFISMYEANLQEQVRAIDTELRLVEDAVLLAKAMAESIFAQEGHAEVTPLTFIYDARMQRFTEKNGDGKGVISIRTANRAKTPTAEQAYDLALSKGLFPLFQSESARKPNIVSMYYIHPRSGSFYYPEYTGPGAQETPKPILPLTSYSFYTDALSVRPKHNRVAWTKPYLDITPRGWMFTATAPVYDERRVLRGVVAADVTIDRFVNHVLDTRFGDEDGFALLLDRDREVIAAQQHGDKQLPQLDLAELFSDDTLNSYRRMKLGDVQKVVFSRSIPTTDWILGYMIPEGKLLEPIHSASEALSEQTEKKLVMQLSLLGLLAVCLSILLAFYLRSKVSRPVKMLADAFAEMGEGQFAAAPLHDTRTLEFNRLLHAFNRMSLRIRELMEEQSGLNQRLEQKVELRTEELRDMNNELERRVKELLRLERWRKELFMNISHDLKTPITLIRGYIEAINDGTIPAAETGRYLRRIYEDIQTINQFVRNLSELSLLETRQLGAAFTLIDADAFFAESARKWDAFMKLEGRPFTAGLRGGLSGIEVLEPSPGFASPVRSLIYGDAHLIGRVIDNLIDNAIKYSGQGCPITFEYELIGGHTAAFRVIDCGGGIPEEDLPYVFNSFYRVDKSRNSGIPGSGLGLSIAKEIVDMHGGSLSVRRGEHMSDGQGPGCIFKLTLPLASAELQVRTG